MQQENNHIIEQGDGNRASCESDIASNTEFAQNAAALRQMQLNIAAANRLDPNFDGVHCIECDEEIEPKRLAVIKTDKCAACAHELDRKNKFSIKKFHD